MYRLMERIDRAEMLRHCTQAFREMLQAGITCVGEFHYLHHPAEAAAGAQGSDEGCTYELDDVLVEAAQAAGIRLVMLCTHYERTGFGGQPVSGPQRRFFSPSTGGLAAHVAPMEAKYDATLGGGDHPAVTFGFAAHSLRATGLPDLVALSDECLSRGAKLHVHLEEQTEEVDSCKRHHRGATPMTAAGRPPRPLGLRHRRALHPHAPDGACRVRRPRRARVRLPRHRGGPGRRYPATGGA